MYWTVNTQQLLHVSPNLMEVLDLNGGPLWSWFIHEQLQVSISLTQASFPPCSPMKRDELQEMTRIRILICL